MSLRQRILSRLLGRALRLQRLIPGRGNLIETFLGAVALAALDPAQLTLLTSHLFASQSRYRDRGMFEWEERWLAADLPPAPARLLVGGAGTGRETRHLIGQGYDLVAFDPVDRFVDRARATITGTESATLLVGSYEDLADPRDARARSFLNQVERGGPYDAVLLGWGSLTHVVEPQDRLGLLTRLKDLCPSGPVLTSFWLRDERSVRDADRARAWGIRLGAALPSGSARSAPVDAADRVMSHSGFGHSFTRTELETLARTAGYTVARFEGNPSLSSFPHATLRPAH